MASAIAEHHLSANADGMNILGVEHPRIRHSYALGMRTDSHAAVEAGEAVGAVEFDGSPLGVEAVDPVVAAEGVGEADGDEVEAPGVCGVGKVALKGKLFHDGIADEF